MASLPHVTSRAQKLSEHAKTQPRSKGKFAHRPSRQAKAAPIPRVDLANNSSHQPASTFSARLLDAASQVSLSDVLGGEQWRGQFATKNKVAAELIEQRLKGNDEGANHRINDLAEGAARLLISAVKELQTNNPAKVEDCQLKMRAAFNYAAGYAGGKSSVFARHMVKPKSPWSAVEEEDWKPPYLDEEKLADFDLAAVLQREQIDITSFNDWGEVLDHFNAVGKAEKTEMAALPHIYGHTVIPDTHVCAETLRDCLAILENKPYDGPAAVNFQVTLLGAIRSALIAEAARNEEPN